MRPPPRLKNWCLVGIYRLLCPAKLLLKGLSFKFLMWEGLINTQSLCHTPFSVTEVLYYRTVTVLSTVRTSMNKTFPPSDHTLNVYAASCHIKMQQQHWKVTCSLFSCSYFHSTLPITSSQISFEKGFSKTIWTFSVLSYMILELEVIVKGKYFLRDCLREDCTIVFFAKISGGKKKP